MNDFSYSVVRSFNQYFNAHFGTGGDSRLSLKTYDPHRQLDSDTVTVQFYDEQIREIGGGRQAGGSRGRFGEFYVQVDCWSPPNSAGESREGTNRQLKDEVEQVWKGKARVPLLAWDGTGGTTVVGGMQVRQQSASFIQDPDMEGFSRWRLDYMIRAVDHES